MMGRTTPWQGLLAYSDLFVFYLNQISGHNSPVKPDSSGKQGEGLPTSLCGLCLSHGNPPVMSPGPISLLQPL